MSKRRINLPHIWVCLSFFLCAAVVAWASVAGSVSGTVKDSSGAVVPHVSVTLQEADTGLSYHTQTDNRGFYILPVLPVGHYELHAEANGFDAYRRSGIVLDTDAALTIDVILQPGTVRQTVTVADNALHIETSSTAMGQVIDGRQMTAVPLNGRSFTDLLSLQPGVAPSTSITATTVQDVGATVLIPPARSIPAQFQ